MARTKIDFGIDLGTTNSAIARMENGEPVIKKTDTLKDTIPSCINFNRKKAIMVGDKAYSSLSLDRRLALKGGKDTSNTFIEFKRTMGTDKKYPSSNMNKDYSSEELAAEVLKTLRSFITDEEIKSVVITVPAKFTINQKDATSRAAKLAGFQHCELLQEPIAASMAYGLEGKLKDGYWLVFDFGGGTFDAALLKVDEGIMKVIDTDGDNYLGGKNIDYALIDELIIPYFEENYVVDSIFEDEEKKEVFRNAWKAKAEEAKIQLSFKETYNLMTDLGEDFGEDDEGEPLELDITISNADMERVVKPIYQKAIDTCQDLLKRNNLKGTSLGTMILVGGPTYSPILRQMLKEQISDKVDTNTDPMTAVAKGAALYASTINVSDEIIEETRDKTKIQLGIGYESSTVELEEFVSVKVLKEKTEGQIPLALFAEIVRGDKAWSSGKFEVNDIGEIVEVKLDSGKTNTFNVVVYDNKGSVIPSEPREFAIIQGTKIGSATLPFNIGIEIMQKYTGRVVFWPIKGLEKNQSLPAVGVENKLKTQKQIRPGISSDFIKIPIYQGEYGARGSRALYNEHVYNVVISGDDLPVLLPAGSDVELTLNSDKSERITGTAYFPFLDYSIDILVPTENVQKEIDAEWLENELYKAKQAIDELKYSQHGISEADLTKLQEDVEYSEKRFNQGKGDTDRKKEVLENLRKSLKKIDEFNEATEWPKLEAELRDEFEGLEKANNELGNEETTRQVNELRQKVDQVIREKDVQIAKVILEEVMHLFFSLTMIYQIIGIIRSWNENFNSLPWTDRSRARQLLNQGLQQIGGTPTVEGLRPIAGALYDLLPDYEKASVDDSVLTM